jgi:hypothetical protein
VAAIALAIVFGSFTTAAAMIAQGVPFLDKIRAAFPQFDSDLGTSLSVALLCLMLLGITNGIAAAMHRLGKVTDATVRGIFCRFSLTLLPLGLAMWLAHLAFHLGAGLPSILPAFQQAAGDLASVHSLSALHLAGGTTRMFQHHFPSGEPHWTIGSGIHAETLLQIQFAVLDGGFLVSMLDGSWRNN